jgi:hypothetical protein
VRTALRPVAGVAFLVLAVALGVLSVQAWRWPANEARHDRHALTDVVPAESTWTGMGGVTAKLLKARDDVSLRHAIVEFRRSRPDDPASARTGEGIIASVAAAVPLGLIERDPLAPPKRRSLAANLQGIMLAEEALFEPDGDPRIRRALELFRRAIRYDPSNGAAKANLQLLLAMTGGAYGTEQSTGGFGGFGRESGSGDPGAGY